MLVQMRVEISGTHNGERYPRVGVPTEVEDRFGAQLCAKGLATPVTTRSRAETATMPEPEARGLTTTRGPGRPRKQEANDG